MQTRQCRRYVTTKTYSAWALLLRTQKCALLIDGYRANFRQVNYGAAGS